MTDVPDAIGGHSCVMTSRRSTRRGARASDTGSVRGWVALAAVLVALPVGAVAWAFSGQTEINGAVSAGPDGAGGVRLGMTLCSGKVDRVELYDQRLHPADRRNPDKPVGIWTRSSPAAADDFLVLGNPGPSWKIELDPGRLHPGAMYDALAWSSLENTELSQVDFDPGRVAELPADRVFVHDAEPVQATAVRSSVCD